MKSRNEYLCSTSAAGQSRLSILNDVNDAHIGDLIHKLELQSGMSLLDVACGAGDITCRIAEKYPDVKVIGIDFSDDQVAAARKMAASRNLKNVEFIVLSAYDLEQLASKYQFDRIFMRWVLGHLKDPKSVIESCKKLLKPHGMMVCEEGDVKTHHCESANKSYLGKYSFFVTNILELQNKRGVDAEIGSRLPALFGAVFKDDATITEERHQAMLNKTAQKQAVTTMFLNETGQKFIGENVLTTEELDHLSKDLDQIAHDDEAKILYTADISVVVKLR